MLKPFVILDTARNTGRSRNHGTSSATSQRDETKAQNDATESESDIYHKTEFVFTVWVSTRKTILPSFADLGRHDSLTKITKSKETTQTAYLGKHAQGGEETKNENRKPNIRHIETVDEKFNNNPSDSSSNKDVIQHLRIRQTTRLNKRKILNTCTVYINDVETQIEPDTGSDASSSRDFKR